MSDKSIVEQIKHYQRDIVKCPDNSKRMLRCIERLTVLPVTIAHLQETGVGRSVNELRKCGGEVGASANALVCKWKSMVKDEEESDQESEVEEEQKSSSVDHRSSSSHRSDSPHKHKDAHSREDHRKSTSSHSSPKKPDLTHSESKSPKKEDRSSSHKSDHRSSRDKSSSKSGYSSSSDSKYNSHRSKSEHDLKSLKKTGSNHGSESECNGNVKSDRSQSNSKYESKFNKSSSTSENKTKDLKQKYDKEKSRKEEISHKSSSQSSIRKYDIRKIESESSDDDSVYKPKLCSVKRKKSVSEEDDKYVNKRSKKPSEKESVKKRKYESSEESNAEEENKSEGSGSDVEDNRDYEGLSESKTNSESEEDVKNRHTVADDKMSDEELESDDNRSSAPESDDREGSVPSGRDNDSEEQSDSSEQDIYVPVKVKREKKSPPRNSKPHSSEKGKLNNSKSSHGSSSHSQKYKTSDNTTKKKDEKFDDVRIKKEKVDKDKTNTQRHKERRSSTDKKIKSNSSQNESSSKPIVKSDKKIKVKIEKGEDGSIDCESGASFGDALLGLSDTKKKPLKKKSTPHQVKSPNPPEKSYTSKSKSLTKSEPRTSSSSSSSKPYKEPDLLSKNVKLEPLVVDLKVTLPEITPNYKPLPHYSPPDSPAYKGQKLSQEDALSSIMYNKNQRTKVYSGNKSGYTKVPSLFELCTQVLRDNIEALEYTGGVPYDLLKPVLDRATADQLFQLEHYNPYLVEDTDGLWQFHCNKDFRGKKPEEFETWRELYLRLLDEREKKLEALKANISQSMAKSTPIRQTKLAYVDSVVKPPRNIARKQMKFGTGKAVKHELVSRAMVGTAGSSPAVEPAVPVPAPPRPNPSSSAFCPVPSFLKKKKAPLMAKALQLIKGNRFKR